MTDPFEQYLQRRRERAIRDGDARPIAGLEAIRRHRVRHGFEWLFGGDG